MKHSVRYSNCISIRTKQSIGGNIKDEVSEQCHPGVKRTWGADGF